MSLWKVTYFVWGDQVQVLVKATNHEEALELIKKPYNEEDGFDVVSVDCLDHEEGILMRVWL